MRVTLLANHRDHHGTTAVGAFAPEIAVEHERLELTDAGFFSLTIRAPDGTIVPKRDWYQDFDLPIEAERGLESTDNHLCVGEVTLPLVPGQWRGIVASLDADVPSDLDAALVRRLDHDRKIVATATAGGPAMHDAPPWIARLALAADTFIVARPLANMPDGKSVIAGYPWFGDWGRDTMISLPGLTLATGRPQIARRILATFASFVSQGMLPNVFPGAGERADYNTADASLWFFEAWRAYFEATKDVATLREAFPVLCDMIEWHQKGTRYGIAVDHADGLLNAGVPGVQLTWMDAKVGDWVVTPRIGTGRNQCAVVQRLTRNEHVRNNFGRAGSLQRFGGRRQTKLCALRPRRRRRFIRRDRWARWRGCHHTAQPDLCREPAAQPAHRRRSAQCRAGVPTPPSHRLRTALARAGKPGLPSALSRWRPGTRRRLPPRAGLAVVAGTVLPRDVSHRRRRKGSPRPTGGDKRRD